MARDRSQTTEGTASTETTVDPTTAATAAAAAANPSAAASNANLKSVKLLAPLGDKPTGTVMARKDFIRHRWTVDRVSRGQITKDLNAMNTVENGGDGKKVPYQVVFAVIKKGTPGGPVASSEGGQTTEGEAAAA